MLRSSSTGTPCLSGNLVMRASRLLSRGDGGDAEEQELLAADRSGIAAHHGGEQLGVRQGCRAELSVVFEVAAGLAQDRGWIATGRILVTGDDSGGFERGQLVEGGDPF